MAFIQEWLLIIWEMIVRSSLFLIVGFLLAGVIRALITPTMLQRIFGKGRVSQVFLASLAGIPLPLCSCSVLPVAAQLRRSGLSREGTMSFLISTPETGVDSIALSFRLLGPVFAIARPIAALLTAFVSGLIGLVALPKAAAAHVLPTVDNSPQSSQGRSFWNRIVEGQHYVMRDLVPELSYYLFWGFLLAGLAAALIPHDLLRAGVPAWSQYLGALIVGLPVYVCATSSTPMAAVLLGLGIAPGAVLTFLLVGPATNLTSLVVQKQILGLRGTVLMTAVVAAMSIILGIILDLTVGPSITGFADINATSPEAHSLIDIISALVFIAVMMYFITRHYGKKITRFVSKG